VAILNDLEPHNGHYFMSLHPK